ncbi:RNA-binding protein 34 [Lampris incognitus]|uniref:RNA-binding protein 34 n=1 Tax=Lampris incognitus TaxID=2546036 RepID=UPI0024B5BA53|nr:RNA-binding protein 34 [Lampris incognitus]
MTKKRQQKSKENLTDKLSADYVVGEVSSSLFPKDSAASGSLSALFSSAPAPSPLVFLPAPKPTQKTSEVKNPPEKISQVKAPSTLDRSRPHKEKSAAERKVEERESALENAEKEEQREKTQKTLKKTKRKASGLGEDGEKVRRPAKKLKRADMEAEAIKTKRTVFVGNLPPSCTKKTLQLLFRDKGAIESIRFRSVVREDPSMSRKLAAITRKVHPKKSSINAYVVFKEEEGVTGALERNGLEIEHGFHIRVDRVTKASSHDHKRSIFVGNLSFELTDEALRQHFVECGKVEAVRIIRDANSGMGKGFGYVLFEDADSVQLALKLDGSKLEGRSVRVRRSVKKQKQTAPGKEATRNTGKGPTKDRTGTEGRGGDTRGPTRGRHRGDLRFGAQRNFTGTKTKTGPVKATKGPSTFKGEMADPSKKFVKKKGLKKKQKTGKRVHI